VFPLRLPALRERRGDILPIAEAMLPAMAARIGRRSLRLGDDARRRLAAADWPGNVRELGNVLERAAILVDGEEIRAEHVLIDAATPTAAPATAPETMEQIERRAIEEALAATGGHRKQAAERLGIGLRTLYEKLRRHGLG